MKRLWLVWAAVAGIVAGLSWLVASLYFLRWIDVRPIAFGALVSVALFPVVLHGLLWIKRGQLKPAGGSSTGDGRDGPARRQSRAKSRSSCAAGSLGERF